MMTTLDWRPLAVRMLSVFKEFSLVVFHTSIGSTLFSAAYTKERLFLCKLHFKSAMEASSRTFSQLCFSVRSSRNSLTSLDFHPVYWSKGHKWMCY